MSEWPDGWFRGGQGEDQQTTDDVGPGGTVRGGPRGGVPSGQVRGGLRGVVPPGTESPASQRTAAPPGSWPDQPPVSSSGAPTSPSRTPVRYPAGPGGPRRYGGSRRRWLRPKRIFGVLAAVVVLALVATVATYFYLNGKLDRSDILVDYPGRPAPGSGTNWLIAGSDSRQGLTPAQMKEYSTGQLQTSTNGLSDTIMILHIPAGGGRPILISVPRDSYVNIPGYGMNKINAAFSLGGPALLAQTIQSDTGLYINHFMDIGFGGFVNVVNAVGGVRMCLPTAIQDQASGLNLPAGCQVLSGGEALAWVRDRHSFATEDLQREQDQRLFLGALLRKMTSTGVILDPFKALPAATGVVSNLTVDQATQLYQLLSAGRALRSPLTTTVPIASANYETAAGDSVLWNSAAATQLFTDLQKGLPVPANLITGSTLG